ncbi:MAG: OB-fold domain-containing protein [Burkholderiaceae bacterium]|nr:OB-fold domain-containing protein [Burkholderiaceae bacterium]
MKPSDESPNAGFADAWWARVRAGESVVQHCEGCGALQMYPRRRCVKCGSAKLGVAPVSGKGRLYTFSTIFHNAPSEFQDQLPYTLGVVVLDEGPQLLSRLVNCEPKDLVCDMPMRWKLARVGSRDLPCFEPVLSA